MNRISKALLSLLLSLSLCLGFALPALANETNDGYTAALNVTELTAGTQQDIVLTVSANSARSLAAIGAQVTWDDNSLTLKAIENTTQGIDFAGSVNLSTGAIAWDGNAGLTMVSGVTEIAKIHFTVPADIQPGEYTLGLENIILADNNGIALASTGDSAKAKLTVNAAETTPSVPAAGYSAGLSTVSAPRVGDQVLVNVNVSHAEDTHFAAGQLTIAYDSTKLRYDSISSQKATVTNEDNTLTLADYGADKALGNGIYNLTFTAIADGDAAVTLTGAAFTDKESATTEDLSPAALENAALTVPVLKRLFDIEMNSDLFIGSETAEEGGTYSFKVASSNYNYTNVTATMGGVPVEVHYNAATQTYSVSNVTGNLTITATRTPKEYGVSFSGEIGTNDGVKATYGQDYHFTLPNNIPVDKTDPGTNYTLGSITIGGAAFTGYTSSGRSYVIPGASVTGDVVVTITATSVPATHVFVTVTGSGAEDAAGFAPIAEKNKSYTLTLDMEIGHDYTVTATMSGKTVELTNHQDGTYSVANVTGNLEFTVTKTFSTANFQMKHYLTLKDLNMYLIHMDDRLVKEGRIPTYDGEQMLWSEKHSSFCYLVIEKTLTPEAAKDNVGITDGEKVTIPDSMDVNGSGTLDASDAQLVYNMYNAEYSAFTDQVTMIKFLLADTNHDHVVNTSDAVTIINTILNP